jgi:hypothetical protein
VVTVAVVAKAAVATAAVTDLPPTQKRRFGAFFVAQMRLSARRKSGEITQ